MKTYLHALCMCRSMFCAIPCPWNRVWDENARDRMLVFLPVIGLEIGLIWWALGLLCRLCHLSNLVAGVLLSLYPVVATGGLHLDGFMDVTDGVKSCRNLEERRRILKDSHVGSFAVIGVVALLLAQFALFASVKTETRLVLLALIPAVSRCCSALAVTLLPPMNTSQYAGQKRVPGHGITLVLMLLAAIAAGFLLGGWSGFALIGELAGYALALRRGFKSLEGMNGDISGYALTIAELAAVAVLVLI